MLLSNIVPVLPNEIKTPKIHLAPEVVCLKNNHMKGDFALQCAFKAKDLEINTVNGFNYCQFFRVYKVN